MNKVKTVKLIKKTPLKTKNDVFLVTLHYSIKNKYVGIIIIPNLKKNSR